MPAKPGVSFCEPLAPSRTCTPGPRSVNSLDPFATRTQPKHKHIDSSPVFVPVALLYHGEKDASALGHTSVGVLGTARG